MTPWTWERIERAAASTSGWKRTRRGEWRGPCRCGGSEDRAWVRSGRRGVVAGCNGGCDGVAVLRWLTGDGSARLAPAFPPRRNKRPRPRPGLGRSKAPGPLEADSGRFRPGPAATPKNEAPGSPGIADRDATRPPVPPEGVSKHRPRPPRLPVEPGRGGAIRRRGSRTLPRLALRSARVAEAPRNGRRAEITDRRAGQARRNPLNRRRRRLATWAT